MTRQYTVEEYDGQTIISYEENGFKVSFGTNPANADYQAYLKSLENAD